MVRSVWSGTLSFGLVAIPVRLVPATEPKDVRFHLVDAESGRRVRYRRVVEADDGSAVVHPDPGAAVSRSGEDDAAPDRTDAGGGQDGSGSGAFDGPEDDPGEERSTAPPRPAGIDGPAEVEVGFESLARGYEVEPGVMVTLTPEEIRAVRPSPSRTIEIEDFVELAAIDPVFFEKSYLVAPQTGGTAERPYALLLRALERAGRVGIGRFVLRTKPHLVAIRPREGALGLETLFFGDEVRDPAEIVPVPTTEVGDRELTMAEQLIEMLATDWVPSRYADTYREELRTLISSKAPRRAPEPVAGAPRGGPSDAERLMDALRESVERAKERGAPEASNARGRPARRSRPGVERTG